MIENISYFDLAVVTLLIIFGIKGFLTGFIKEAFGLIGIIGGIFIASRYANDMGNFIDTHIYHIINRASVYFIGFVCTLLLFWLSSLLVGFIFTKLVNLSGLSLINRLLGFATGSLKIFLLFSILIFALRSMEIFKDNIDVKLKNSILYPYLIKSGDYIVKFNIDNTGKAIKSIKKKIISETNASRL